MDYSMEAKTSNFAQAMAWARLTALEEVDLNTDSYRVIKLDHLLSSIIIF